MKFFDFFDLLHILLAAEFLQFFHKVVVLLLSPPLFLSLSSFFIEEIILCFLFLSDQAFPEMLRLPLELHK